MFVTEIEGISKHIFGKHIFSPSLGGANYQIIKAFKSKFILKADRNGPNFCIEAPM